MSTPTRNRSNANIAANFLLPVFSTILSTIEISASSRWPLAFSALAMAKLICFMHNLQKIIRISNEFMVSWMDLTEWSGMKGRTEAKVATIYSELYGDEFS